jgi:hypothetical protein
VHRSNASHHQQPTCQHCCLHRQHAGVDHSATVLVSATSVWESSLTAHLAHPPFAAKGHSEDEAKEHGGRGVYRNTRTRLRKPHPPTPNPSSVGVAHNRGISSQGVLGRNCDHFYRIDDIQPLSLSHVPTPSRCGSLPYEPKIVGFCVTGAPIRPPTWQGSRAWSIHPMFTWCACRAPDALTLHLSYRHVRKGADGVLICGCHPGDCHFISRNYKALARVTLLKRFWKIGELNRSDFSSSG